MGRNLPQTSTLALIMLFAMAISAMAKDHIPPDSQMRIAISDDFAPFRFVNAEGKPAVLLVDI